MPAEQRQRDSTGCKSGRLAESLPRKLTGGDESLMNWRPIQPPIRDVFPRISLPRRSVNKGLGESGGVRLPVCCSLSDNGVKKRGQCALPKKRRRRGLS